MSAVAPSRRGLWLAVVVLTALNLRSFLTAIGPLTHDIRAATGLDLRGMAWLTLWLTLALQAAGLAALVEWPDVAPRTWALLLGAGLGGSFALTMVVALDHLPDPAQAGTLSALMQGGGFCRPPWHPG